VPYDFSIDELKSHLDLLRSRGFRFISLGDLYAGNVAGSKNILVTIDDGNHSVYRAYFEVFKPMGIRPLLSIYPNIIGKKDYAMTWDQLKRLSAEGCDIAAHGYYHLKINKKLYDENRADFNREIVTSKKVLQDKLGIAVTSFVYPFGLNTDEGEKALRNAGYKVAFTIVNNPVKTPLGSNSNSMRLPRYMLTRQLYQGSLKHIVRLSERGSRTILAGAAEPARIVPREKVPGNGYGRSAKKKSALAMKKAPAGEGRYGDDGDEKSSGTRAPRNGKAKRKKGLSRKDITLTPRPDSGDRDLPEMVNGMMIPADTIYRLNIGKSAIGAVSADIPKVDAVAPRDGSGDVHGPPGKFKERWLGLGHMVIEEYRRIISLHLGRAATFIHRLITAIRHG